ncbi:MAG TPA: hypothetical protein DCW74_05760 [Alteromonas australica]|uniref:Uncharacterized protein n=1 Tax=Alteromonas australica TaxID=589873 RepID=A0A350P1R1_9ALTE|nr:hypothetical protein [Alteromonas australica]
MPNIHHIAGSDQPLSEGSCMTNHFETAEKIAREKSRKAAGWYLEDVLESLPAHKKVLADCTARELKEWQKVRDQIDKYLWW